MIDELNSTDLLGDLAEVRGGWTSSASSEGTSRLVRTTDISDGSINWSSVPYSDVQPPDSNRYALMAGDVLVARTGVGSVGNVAFVDAPRGALFASYLICLRPRKRLRGDYLAYFLKSPVGRGELARRAKGATIPNLSAARLKNLEIPIPSLEMQQRIANRLAKYDAQLRLARSRLREFDAKLDAISARQWELTLAVAKTTNGDLKARGLKKRLADVATFRDGKRKPLNASQRAGQPGSTPYYGASGVIDTVSGHTHEGNFVLISEDGNNLISRRTPIAFAASGRIWVNNHVHVLDVSDGLEAEYLIQQINGMDVTKLLTGTTQPKLGLRKLAEVMVEVPAMEDQLLVVNTGRVIAQQLASLAETRARLFRHIAKFWDIVLSLEFGQVENGGTSNLNESDGKVPQADESHTLPVGAFANVRDALSSGAASASADVFRSINWGSLSGIDAVDAFYVMLSEGKRDGWLREYRDQDSAKLERINCD